MKKNFVLLTLVILFLYIFVRVGYCNRWWGEKSLFMRSLWLCSCGAEFEQSIYPDHAKVLFSACDNVNIVPVAKAEDNLLLVYGDNTFSESDPYLWQPISDKKTPFFPPEKRHIILSEELVLIHGRYNVVLPQVINFRSGESASVSIFDATMLPPIYLKDGSINPEVFSMLFDDDSQIFVELKTGSNIVIVLGKNWAEQPEGNFYLSEALLPDENEGWLKDVIESSGKSYTELYSNYSNKWNLRYSPDGRYYADKQGIHELTGNELILSMAEANQMTPCPEDDCSVGFAPVGFEPCCWLADNSAVLYEFRSGGLVLFETLPLPAIYFGAPIKNLTTSMPILKVTVPQD